MLSEMGVPPVPPPVPNYLPMPTGNHLQTFTPGWVQSLPQHVGNPNPSGGVQPTGTLNPSDGVQQAQFMINGTGCAPSAGVPVDEVQVNRAWFSLIHESNQ